MVIDTSAMIAFLRDEPEAAAIEDAISTAEIRAVSAFTIFEARTVTLRRFGMPTLGELEGFLARIRPEVHAFDADHATLAFAAYRRFGKGSGHPAQLNLGDCAAYALATSLDLPLLYKGQD